MENLNDNIKKDEENIFNDTTLLLNSKTYFEINRFKFTNRDIHEIKLFILRIYSITSQDFNYSLMEMYMLIFDSKKAFLIFF